MATRSLIGQLQADGTIRYIYCHSDGYLECNGRLLNEHWRSRADVEKMLDEGSMSILGEHLGQKHDFDDYKARGSGCRFYGRDRGETDVDARVCKLSEWSEIMDDYWAEFSYLQDMNGNWSVIDLDTGDSVDLETALAKLAA